MLKQRPRDLGHVLESNATLAHVQLAASLGVPRLLEPRHVVWAGVQPLCQALIDVNSEIPMIGASGAISGILGAYLILFPKKDIKVFFWFFIFIKIFRIPAMFVIGGWIFIQFFSLNSSEESNIAYLAHIGGFIAGIILIIIFRKKISKQSKRLTKGSLPNSN